MADFAARMSPIHMLRTALSRLLIEFQNDLRALEAGGLEPHECTDVKMFLAQAIATFEQHGSDPTSPYTLIAKHFRKFAEVYADWNGHEGADPGNTLLRRRELSSMVDKRRKLFRKLSSRQQEVANSPQLDLPFSMAVRLPLKELAARYPDRFPRLRQATQLFS